MTFIKRLKQLYSKLKMAVSVRLAICLYVTPLASSPPTLDFETVWTFANNKKKTRKYFVDLP